MEQERLTYEELLQEREQLLLERDELRSCCEMLEAQNLVLHKRLDHFEERLGKNSTNSSKPPSSDGPAGRPKRTPGPRIKRKRGAQPGHKGHHRQLFDDSRIHQHCLLKPTACRRCAGPLDPAGPHQHSRFHEVLWRKRSYGTDSERGSRYVERILTCIESLRLQGRCALDYLHQTLAAWRQGLPTPSLLPS